MQDLGKYIEHTNLHPLLTYQDIDTLVEEAKTYQFGGVCVPPYWVEKVKRDLKETNIQVVTVIGFPLGYTRTEIKKEEINWAMKNGADELDMVMNISAFKSGSFDWVKAEIAQFAKLIHSQTKILKVIIETAYLNKSEIAQACKICADAGTDFVKTSTGFAPKGAQLEDIQYMREILPTDIRIKASGGIKTYQQALSFIEAGADRIGTSSGVNIVENKK